MRRARRVDEGPQLGRRERAVQVAQALGGLGVEVVAAEDQLERAAAAHEARQALRAGAARQDAERDLGLVITVRAARAEAHVAATARARCRRRPRVRRSPRSPPSACGGSARTWRGMGCRRPARRAGRGVDREREDRLDVEMRDPEVRVVAAQHDGAHRVVGARPRPRSVRGRRTAAASSR